LLGFLAVISTPVRHQKRRQAELLEEISYTPPSVTQFRRYSDDQVIRHVFHAPLTVELHQLVLGECWDMGLLTPEQIKSGVLLRKGGSSASSGASSPTNFAGFLEQR
jgi:hypothetical protein